MGRRTRAATGVIGALVAAAAISFATAMPAVAQTSTATTTAATTTDTADAYCDVTFAVISQWSTGYGVGLSVRNISAVPVRWELLRVWFPAPALAIQVWNASATQSGSVLSITPYPPAGLLGPGEARMVATVFESGRFVTPPPYQVVCTPA